LSDAGLQFVVGKGGVGKSTLTAALGLEAASHGQRTLVAEIGRHGGLSRLFDAEDIVPGAPRVVAPHLTLLTLEGDEALAEYLRLVIPIKRLLSLVFASRFYSIFVAGAPGLKELMTVGKIWFEAERRMADGQPVWERMFVDAGASGHSLQYLQMPSAAATAFRSGLVHREATRVQQLLADPKRTCVHVVATPEEMPVTEACSIIERLRGDLHFPLGDLFVNRCRPPVPRGAAEAIEVLGRLPAEGEAERLRAAMTEAATDALEWDAVQQAAISRLEECTGLRAERVPLLVREEFGIDDARELVSMLAARRKPGFRPKLARSQRGNP
jgi:anion-transporting  ArsA/GET3 family ATPase